MKKEKEVSEDAGTSTITLSGKQKKIVKSQYLISTFRHLTSFFSEFIDVLISDLDDKTLSKELSLVEKIKETKAIVHKDSSETDEKNLNKDPEKQKLVKKEKMRILQDDSKLKTDKIKVKPKDKSDSPNNQYLSPNLRRKPTYDKSKIIKGSPNKKKLEKKVRKMEKKKAQAENKQPEIEKDKIKPVGKIIHTKPPRPPKKDIEPQLDANEEVLGQNILIQDPDPDLQSKKESVIIDDDDDTTALDVTLSDTGTVYRLVQ